MSLEVIVERIQKIKQKNAMTLKKYEINEALNMLWNKLVLSSIFYSPLFR